MPFRKKLTLPRAASDALKIVVFRVRPMSLRDDESNKNSRWILRGLFGYFLFVPPVALCLGDNTGAGILAAVGAASILFTRIQDLVEFSGFGVAAKLEKKMNEAEAIIRQLRSISAALAKGSLQQIAMSGELFSGIDTKDKFNVRDEIVDSLKEMGVSEHVILEAQGLWIARFGNLLLTQIIGKASDALSLERQAVQAELRELPISKEYDLPTPDALVSWGRKKGNQELLGLVQGYQRLMSTGGMDKPEIIPFNAGFNHHWRGQ